MNSISNKEITEISSKDNAYLQYSLKKNYLNTLIMMNIIGLNNIVNPVEIAKKIVLLMQYLMKKLFQLKT